MDFDDLNEVFTAWADLGRTSSPEGSTGGSWNEMLERFSYEGQRRMRFMETTAYAATHDCFPDKERIEVAYYVVMLGLLNDIGYNRPKWLQGRAADGLQGALHGLGQREAVYRGVASVFEDRWVPEDAVRPHCRLVQALRGLAGIDRNTARHLRLYRTTEHYVTGEREMRTAFENIDRSIADMQSTLQAFFKEEFTSLFERIFVRTVVRWS